MAEDIEGVGGEEMVLATSKHPDLSEEFLKELAAIQDSTLPAAYLSKAAGKIRSPEAVIDFATVVCMAVAQGQIKVSQSTEMRKWAELMYTCIQADKLAGESSTNYITQLIQIAGGSESAQMEKIEATSSIPQESAAELLTGTDS